MTGLYRCITFDRWFGRAALTAAALLAAAGCSGNLIPAGSSANNTAFAHKLPVRFIIRVPHKPHHDGRAPRYISPNTLSIAIAIATSPGGTTAAKLDANLTPTSGGCATTNTATVCQKNVALAPGTYAATVTTYDQQNQGGSILSEGQSLPVAVVVGKSNTISLILGGVPHSVTISAGGRGIQGSQGAGFTLLGSGALPFTIAAKDADNNTIVGNSSLSYTASIQSGTGWAVQATPKPSAPNTFKLTPPGKDGSTATVKLTFHYSSTACGQSGAVCTVSFNAQNHIQILAIADCEIGCANGTGADAVQLYDTPFVSASSSGGPFATITTGVVDPVAVAIDKAGTLFVANCQVSCAVGANPDTITVYQPPFTNSSAPSATIATGVNYPSLLAFTSSGDLFVDDCGSCSNTSSMHFNDVITFYSHANYAGAPTTITPTAVVAGMTVDSNDNLLIAACRTSCGAAGADAIFQYGSPYNGAPTAVTNGVGLNGLNAGGLGSEFAIDASANLWSVNCFGCGGGTPTYSATRYAAPLSGSSSPNVTISTGLNTPISIALDSSANAFIASGPGGLSGNYISEFTAASAYGTGSQLFGGANYQAIQILADGFDNLLFTDGGSVQVAAPPYATMTQIATTSSPTGNQPLALSP